MAKQLYDYWFVQFDFPNEDGKPYKSSGGEIAWNDIVKKKTPINWDVQTLQSLIQENKSGDWGKEEPTEGLIKVGCIRGADILSLNNLPIRYITDKHKKHILCEGDIVIEVSGGSPIQATGRVALITEGVLERNGQNLVCSNFCQSFTLKDTMYSEYFYYLWSSLYDNGNMFNYEGKTSGIKNFLTDSFLANHWYIAPNEVVSSFHNIVKKLHSLRDKCIKENNMLTKQRDELLLLLMNGQVTVNYDLSHIIFFTLKVSCYNARNKYYNNGKGTDKDYFRSHQWVSEYRTKQTVEYVTY